ncbi:MAG: cell division protein FtsZ [Dehalococcoidia bacterium]
MGDGQTLTDRGAVIKVLGVGGGGSNAVNRMYKERVPGVEYVVINTDTQHLSRNDVPTKVAIGQRLTRGLGVGGNPELGRQAAEESREELAEMVKGADMVFITAGMGGGTGTGAAPTIAELAKENGALTVAVVSKPFVWEVYQRRKNAEDGITRLKDKVDTLIGIPNDRLLSLSQQREELYTWEDALKLADTVLQQGVQTIAEVVTVPGEINVDFADVKAVMSEAGPAWMALGKGRGEHRAIEAARQATKSPLLDISIEGARRILFVLTGGTTLTLKEVQEAADAIQEVADPEANVIFGTVKDLKMDDEVKITLIATGFPSQEMLMQQEEGLRRLLRETASNGDEEDLEVPTFLRREAARMRRARPGFIQ